MSDRAEIEASLQRIAGKQFGLVTRTQMLGASLSKAMIKHRQDQNRLLPAGRAVFAVGRRAEGRLAACMAATLVAGAVQSSPAGLLPMFGTFEKTAGTLRLNGATATDLASSFWIVEVLPRRDR